MQPTSAGRVFFDNSTIGEIDRRQLAAPLRRSLRAVGLEAWATRINVIESHSAPWHITERLIATLRALGARDAAWPFPNEILEAEARAFLAGETRRVDLQLDALSWFDAGIAPDAAREESQRFRKLVDSEHRQMHAARRAAIQAKLKARGIRANWAEFPRFLEAWQGMDMRGVLAALSWRDLQLPEPFAPGILEWSDAWRLLCDADALGLFQAAIAFDQPRQVQRMDQLQLPYLGGGVQRILVTRDGPFVDAAKMIVNGRYSLARVMTLVEFLETSGL